MFDPDTFEPLTVPLVSFRYAVDRLVRSATLSRDAGNALVEACARLHYTQRTYTQIFQNSPLAQNRDLEDIARLLCNFDLKREDAQLLLETMAPLEPTETTEAVAVECPAPRARRRAFRPRSRSMPRS